MIVKQGFPPNIQAIAQEFKITPDTVFAYGDTLYNPLGLPIPQDLMIHEETHEKQQQALGVEQWWTMYLDRPNFRLQQEVEAYQNQYEFIKTVLNRKGRIAALNRFAEQLSSDLYGKIINKKKAKELIDGW